MNQVIEHGRVPEIPRLIGIQDTLERMGTECSECYPKKPRRSRHDQWGATTHGNVPGLLGSDLELLGELLEEALDGPGGRLTEGADGTPGDVVGDILEGLGILSGTLAIHHASGHLVDPENTLAARGALTTALMGVELVEIIEGPEHVARVIHDDDATTADHGSGSRKAGGIHDEIEERNLLVDHFAIGSLDLHLEDLTGTKNFGGATTGDHRLELAARLHATTDVVNQFTEGDSTGRDLVGSGSDDVAGDAHDAGTTITRGTHLGILLGAQFEDLLNMAEGLHVVDDGRRHVEAENCWEVRRLDAGIGTLSLKRLDEAGLFTADVGTRALVDVDVDVESGTADILAQEALGTGLLKGLGDDLGRLGELASDVDIGQVDIQRVGGNGHPLDELVGIVMQDVAILEGTGLGFIAVAGDVVGLAVITANEAPLDPAWESSTTTAAKVGLLDLVDDFLGLHLEGLFQLLVAAILEIAVDVGRVPLGPGVLEDDATLLGMRGKKKGFHGCGPLGA